MSIHYCLSLLTMLTGHGATVPNVPESPRDTSTLMTLPHEDVLDAEVRILCGKYIYIFVHILLIFSFFLFIFFFFFFLKITQYKIGFWFLQVLELGTLHLQVHEGHVQDKSLIF